MYPLCVLAEVVVLDLWTIRNVIPDPGKKFLKREQSVHKMTGNYLPKFGRWFLRLRSATPTIMKTLFASLIFLISTAEAKTLIRCKLSSESSVVAEVKVTAKAALANSSGLNHEFTSWIKNVAGDSYSLSIDPLEWLRKDITLPPLESESHHTYRMKKVDEHRWILKEISTELEARFFELSCTGETETTL